MLVITAKEEMDLQQFGVTTAFSYVDLNGEIYIEQLDELKERSTRVCKRKKSLHVLK